MMHPSYSELMDIINQESESEENQVGNSRYAVRQRRLGCIGAVWRIGRER